MWKISVNLEVMINGRAWKVTLEPAEQPGQVTAVIKGRRRVVDAVWVDRDTLSLVEHGKVHEVGIERRDAREIDVVLGGTTFRAAVSTGGRRERKGRAPASPPEGRQTIAAPMPGRVVRVLVAAGDRVIAGQGVVTVEAMKMENELRSPKDGTVTQIAVQEGTAIDAGTVLVVIE